MSTHDDINVEEIENLDFEKYEDKYSESGLWDKIRKNIAKIGVKVIYQALLLYYVAQSPNCPSKIKAGIIGALGYLISPIDLIPDIMPGIGYADDAAAIATAVALAQIYITDEIKAQAKAKIADLLGEDVLANLDDGAPNMLACIKKFQMDTACPPSSLYCNHRQAKATGLV